MLTVAESGPSANVWVVASKKRGAQPFRQQECLLARRIRKQARELFTSDPAEQIGRPQQRRSQLTKCDKHCITGGVPKFVVDALEAIEIERKKRGRPVGKTGSDHQSFARLEKATTIRNACLSGSISATFWWRAAIRSFATK